MSTEYQVLTSALRVAAAAALDAGDQIAQIDLTSALDDEVKLAVPGSHAVELATALGSAWRERIKLWSSAASHYAERVSACADTYDAVDQDHADAFRSFIHRDAPSGPFDRNLAW